METTGTIIQILPAQTGTGRNGAWKKQEFILETTDMYPKKICLAAWGDKIDISRFSTGQSVRVAFDVESREYNGKWYTDCKAFSLQPLNKEAGMEKADQPPSLPDQEDDLPF